MSSDNNKPISTFKRTYFNVLLLGIFLIFCFFIIYIIIVARTGQINFYSFLYHNMKNNLFITILSGFYVSILGFGILLTMTAFFNLPLKVKCYRDKFVVSMYLQKNRVIDFSKIDKISTRIYYLNYDYLFKKYEKKECRIFIHNPEHIFYFCYPVKGYFDEVKINLKKAKENMDERCVADRDSILKILTLLKKNYNLAIPYMPEENSESEYDNNKRNSN